MKGRLSVSIIIPCRNERGNIEPAKQPRFAPKIEIVFVEGHSSDGTWEEVQRVKRDFPPLDIKIFQQTAKGKGDAVRKGFAEARGDLLMILDAGLIMPPEDLPKFDNVISSRKGEFINGSCLVYPQEKQAMQLLNYFPNYMLARLFSFPAQPAAILTRCAPTFRGGAITRKAPWPLVFW